MDGNGRWAKAQGKTRQYGHKIGSSKVYDVFKQCIKLGCKSATFFAMSSENMLRSDKETEYISALLKSSIEEHLSDLLSNKTKLHLDYFTGDATTLKFFLISPDGNGDGAAEEKAFELDLTSLGQWNSVNIDLSHFSDVVDLNNVFQFKVEGNGSVYFDNIFFYGGGSGSGDDNSAQFTGVFGGATVVDNVFNFPSAGTESWAGFANENAAIYPLAFPHGGKITFTGLTAGTDVDIKFKFEFKPHPDTEPSYTTSNVTISGTEAIEYTVDIPSQGTEKTFSSLLLYLVTQDNSVTLTNIVVREYAAPSGTNNSAAYTGTFGGATSVNNVYTFPTGTEAWAGFANENAGIYPLSFSKGGKIKFNGSTAGVDVSINFKFEFKPHPDTEPSFSTSNITISGTESTEYSVDIPIQDAANTFSSALMYLVTQDAGVTLTDFVITSYE